MAAGRPNPVAGGPDARGATEPVVAAAVAFLATLSAEQRDRAVYDHSVYRDKEGDYLG